VQDQLAALHIPYLRKPFDLDDVLAAVLAAHSRLVSQERQRHGVILLSIEHLRYQAAVHQ
jgi:ActR/RegA family two-component response regulator